MSNRGLAVAGYGVGVAAFGYGAVTTALPLLSGRWEFPSGGPYWIPAAVLGVMTAICAVGLYRVLTREG